MDTILVTGGAGFIGSCFVRSLVADDRVRIVNLDKLTYAGNLDSLEGISDHPRHVFVHGDICDQQLVGELLENFQPRAIVNIAAESHVDRSIAAPAEFLRTNVIGTVQLLEAAKAYWQRLSTEGRNTFRFLQVSTDEVYGTLGESGLFEETTAYAPNSPYSASKASSDHFVRAFHKTYGLPTLITHCSNNYGPFQFPEKLIPLTILRALAGKPLRIYGDGKHIRDWLHVEDHCRALRIVLDQGEVGESYNVGGHAERTNMHVVEHICDIVDRLRPQLTHRPCRSLITFVEDRPGHDRRYAIDTSKVKRDFGWEPLQDFESGLEATVTWYLENTGWIERVASGIYQDAGLGVG